MTSLKNIRKDFSKEWYLVWVLKDAQEFTKQLRSTEGTSGQKAQWSTKALRLGLLQCVEETGREGVEGRVSVMVSREMASIWWDEEGRLRIDWGSFKSSQGDWKISVFSYLFLILLWGVTHHSPSFFIHNLSYTCPRVCTHNLYQTAMLIRNQIWGDH